jgi:hypothetical protein
MKRYSVIPFLRILLFFLILMGLVSPTYAQPPLNKDYRTFAYNNLGMHCYDGDFSVFSLLPPFNIVRSQVIYRGMFLPQILTNYNVSLTYSATPDPTGSINSTSLNKTDFWDYIQPLYGLSQPVDTGILGAKMPGTVNSPQVMKFEQPYKTAINKAPLSWFAANGIPMTNLDDTFSENSYPMMRIQTWDRNRKNLLSAVDTVVPVSSEMNCASCHETGMDAAATPDGSSDFHGVTDDAWSQDPRPIVRYRENILILHDAVNNTTLMNSKPVLCASCHYSKALDLSGKGPQPKQQGHVFLSLAMHRHHGLPAGPGANSNAGVIPIPEPDAGPSVQTCYFCHPGSDTQCLRSVMAVKGVTCQNCHGGLTALGGVDNSGSEIRLKSGKIRQPWTDLPKCQSCHTGDAVSHLGDSIVLKQAYIEGDTAANARIVSNKRFAENNNTLYQMSNGHGGVACESCHGSTHAEWPARANGNDDITAMQLQGHTGPIIECTTCHKQPLPQGLRGPHGLHSVNDTVWNKVHKAYYLANRASCKACHGTDSGGTILSTAATSRNLKAKGNAPVAIVGGTQVSCSICHPKPVK